MCWSDKHYIIMHCQIYMPLPLDNVESLKVLFTELWQNVPCKNPEKKIKLFKKNYLYK
jgi:hypothetical protein